MNYAATSQMYSVSWGNMFYPIKILAGNYEFSTPIYYGIGNHTPSDYFDIVLEGSGYDVTSINYTGTGNAITIDGNINNVYLKDFSIDNPNTTADTMIYWNSIKGSGESEISIENIGNSYGTSSYLMYFNNVYTALIKNILTPAVNTIYINGSGGNTGHLYMQNMIWSGASSTIGNYQYAYVSGQSQRITVNNPIQNLKLINFNGGVTFNAPVNTFIAENGLVNGYNDNPAALVINADVNYIKLLSCTVQGTLLGSTNTSTNYTIGVLSIDGLYNIYQHEAFSNVTNVKINAYDFKNIPSGTYTTMPNQSSTNGTTAGTVSMLSLIHI